MSFRIYFDKTTSGEPCARLEMSSPDGKCFTRVSPYGKKFNRTAAQAKQILLSYIKSK